MSELAEPTEKPKPKTLLPTQKKVGVLKNLRELIIYGIPKVGKTTALAKLPNCLIIDTEKGTDFIEGAFILNFPEGLGALGKWRWLKDLAAEIKKDKPYDYVCIDTLTELDELAIDVGTANYMASLQGKNFNRDEDGNLIKKNDPRFESVLTLPNGYGWRYTREAILEMFETLKGLGKICTIFACHVTDKMISKNGSSEVNVKDLALVGKVRDIIPRRADAVASVYQENGELCISFVGSEFKVGGVRATHLVGYEGKLDWDKIFIK